MTSLLEVAIARENVFSFEGRISRARFLFLTIAPYIFIFFASKELRGGAHLLSNWQGIVAAIGMMLGSWISLATWAKRFHDLGKSGWNALWQGVPAVNFFVWLYLARDAGQAEPNKYGDPPE